MKKIVFLLALIPALAFGQVNQYVKSVRFKSTGIDTTTFSPQPVGTLIMKTSDQTLYIKKTAGWRSLGSGGSSGNFLKVLPSSLSANATIDGSTSYGVTFTVSDFQAQGSTGFTIAGPTGNQFTSSTSGMNLTITQGASGFTVSDLRGTPTGLTYSADYSSTFAARSIVDKSYVDLNVITSASVSTSNGTITLDLNSLRQKMFYGSATFGTSKTMALSNASNALLFNFIFEITSTSATLTLPNDWLMADPQLSSHVYTFLATGKYELGGSWNGTNWYVKIIGPFQ